MRTLARHLPAQPVAASPTAVRLGLGVAGVLLAIYPVTRPWSDTASGGAAEAFASPRWPIAHTAAVLGFLALALALRAWPRRAGATHSPLRDPRRAESRAWIAVALLGPYFGAEAYGLHVIGQRAQESGDASLTELADQFRYAAIPVTLFALGLLALALVGGRLVALTADGQALERAGGVLAGLGLLTYLPQFFLPPAGRVVHGLLLGAGLLLIAGAHTGRARLLAGEVHDESQARADLPLTQRTPASGAVLLD